MQEGWHCPRPRSPWPLILQPGPAGVGWAPLLHLAASQPLHCQGLVANGQVQPLTPVVSPLPRAARLSGHNGGHGALRRVGVRGGGCRWVPLRGQGDATGLLLWGRHVAAAGPWGGLLGFVTKRWFLRQAAWCHLCPCTLSSQQCPAAPRPPGCGSSHSQTDTGTASWKQNAHLRRINTALQAIHYARIQSEEDFVTLLLLNVSHSQKSRVIICTKLEI